LFKKNSVIQLFQNFIGQITVFTQSLFSGIDILELFNIGYLHLYAFIVFLVIYEMLQYYKNDELFIYEKSFYYQLAFYMALFFFYIEIENFIGKTILMDKNNYCVLYYNALGI